MFSLNTKMTFCDPLHVWNSARNELTKPFAYFSDKALFKLLSESLDLTLVTLVLYTPAII